MLIADTSLSLEPAWPWSIPTMGTAALLGAAFLLVGLTLWTYLGVQKATWRRIAIVVVLRLCALLVAFSSILRPSFAFTVLEGVEVTNLLAVFDASESMGVAEVDGKPTRWEQAAKLWASPDVQRRIDRLRSEQKIDVVKYLADDDLRPDQADASPTGKRTDIGAWLRQLRLKHGHERHLRGVILISDGADNGTRFSAAEEARAWRGLAPIHAFGAGDPTNPRYRKDIGLTRLIVAPESVPVNSKFVVKGVAQAPGFKGAEVEAIISMEPLTGKKGPPPLIAKVRIADEKDQPIDIPWIAPGEAGEYKLTLKITPHPDEANKLNNEISTFVQVIKPQINVLWIDRPRVYEPTFAIRYALAPEPRFKVYYFSGTTGDPLKEYEFDQRHYDVIVIGDISAQRFALGDPKSPIFERIKQMVTKESTGLLMLGGTETFAKGGWDKQPAITELLPVILPADSAKTAFVKTQAQAVPATGAPDLPFLKLDGDVKKNAQAWKQFDPLDGYAPIGVLSERSTPLLRAGSPDTGVLLMAARRNADEGHVVVFAADSTWRAWYGSKEAVAGYKKYWKQLIFWLAKQQDQANQLVLRLDKRRINANAGDVLGFTAHLRGKDGSELAGAIFTAKVIGPGGQEFAVNLAGERGTFQGAKEPGEHRLVVKAKAGAITGDQEARFLVAFDDIELLRPVADHETLKGIVANSDGRFHVLDEQALVRYLDELSNQVTRESRHKTTHWPDWSRLPASEQTRDQLAGLWTSFALVGFLLFTSLLGCEWLLRRLWGLV